MGQSSDMRARGKRPAAPSASADLQPGDEVGPRGGGSDRVPGHRVPPARRARRDPLPCPSSRLRSAIAAWWAATSRAWDSSSAKTSRSRKRRRPEALSPNSRSICGVSQTAATRAAMRPGCAAARHRAGRRGARSAPGRTAGADVERPSGRLEAPGDRPGCGAMPRHVGDPGTAQAAPRGQQRDGFKQVRLAAAVRPR
jgi:hypothetical protein